MPAEAGLSVFSESPRRSYGRGSQVVVENKAGAGSGFSDDQYEAAGARIVHQLDEVYGRADIIVKVNRPVPEEYPLLREGQILMASIALLQLARQLPFLRCVSQDGEDHAFPLPNEGAALRLDPAKGGIFRLHAERVRALGHVLLKESAQGLLGIGSIV